MRTTPVPKVLVVDDEPDVRLSIQRALELESYEVQTVESGVAALDFLRDHSVDVIILDVAMPLLDGLTTCRRLRASGNRVPVLMLTAKSRTIDQVIGLDAGADDYLVKPFDLDVLYARLRSLLRRSHGTIAGLHELGDLVVDIHARTARRSGKTIDFTPREFDLLELLVTNPNEVILRDWMIERVWGANAEVSPNSIDVFIASVLRKLDAHGGTRLIHTVRGVGYVAKLDLA